MLGIKLDLTSISTLHTLTPREALAVPLASRQRVGTHPEGGLLLNEVLGSGKSSLDADLRRQGR